MQRITDILTSVLLFIVKFVKNLTVDLFHALYFKAIEYDDYLKERKTTTQRILAWTYIVVGVLVVLVILLNLFYTFINNLEFVESL